MGKGKTPRIRFKGFTDDWEQRKVGDITRELSEYTTISSGLPLLTSSRSGIMYQSDYRDNATIQNEDTMFSVVPLNACTYRHMSDDDTFHLNINTLEKGLVSREYPVFTSQNSNLNFIVENINSNNNFIKFCKAQKKGGTRTRLYYKNLCEFDLLVPSIEEQNKIEDYLSNLNNLIALHQRKLDKLKTTKNFMLENMFPKNGEKRPRIRFSGFTDDWEQRKVGELTNVLSASRVHKEDWTDEGVPFFRSSDVVAAFKGTENDKAFISFELYEQLTKSSGKLEKNDILITGGGSIGIPYIVPDNETLYSKDADLIWIKHSANFDSRYLYIYFTSKEFRDYLSSISHTGTIAHYTIEQVKDTPVGLSSIDEQKQIGAYFDSLDHLIALHQRKLDKMKKIKQSMLEKMFV